MQCVSSLRRSPRLLSAAAARRLLRTSPACLDADEDDTSTLTKQRWDVVISGAGLAGAALACALGTSEAFANKRVLLVDRRQLRSDHDEENWSNRVYALTPGSRSFLQALGVWDMLPKSKVQTIKRMRVWESHSSASIAFFGRTAAGEVAFDVDMTNLADALYRRLAQLPSEVVRVCSGVKVVNYELPTLERHDPVDPCPPVRIHVLGEDKPLETSLLVGADGFNSQVRKSMGVRCLQWNYNQKSIIATVKLCEPVDNSVAWQRFLPHGVVALLPLDSEHSSLVWTARSDLADKLMQLPEDSFVDALNKSIWGTGRHMPLVDTALSTLTSVLQRLGIAPPPSSDAPMHILSLVPGSRATFPLGLSYAAHYVLPRVALIGDAAHRVHPMAGQGANLGFGDAQELAQLLVESVYNGEPIVSFDTLLHYETQRQRHTVPFLLAIEALVGMYRFNMLPVVAARSVGLQLIDACVGLKERIVDRASY
ncbi:ubiquinone biosynthesis protein COQ6, mitochondrial [Amblyomma americanum]